MVMFDNDPTGFGLSRFYKPLLGSEVAIFTLHTAEDIEKNPFDIDNCSYIAIAISILADYFFVAGIETFSNNRDPKSPSLGPWTSLFMGKKNGQVSISSSDELRLVNIYDFVFKALRASTYDESKSKLIFYYLRSTVKTSNQPFTVLKLGIQPVLNQRTAVVVNTALFFEHVFTKESRDLSRGVKEWNKVFGSTTHLNFDDIDLILKYRHILVHDNATTAQAYINQWKKKNNVLDDDMFEKIETIAISVVKSCMRTIIEDYPNYQLYRTSL
jgi:hypothetical protein